MVSLQNAIYIFLLLNRIVIDIWSGRLWMLRPVLLYLPTPSPFPHSLVHMVSIQKQSWKQLTPILCYIEHVPLAKDTHRVLTEGHFLLFRNPAPKTFVHSANCFVRTENDENGLIKCRIQNLYSSKIVSFSTQWHFETNWTNSKYLFSPMLLPWQL